MNELIYVSMAYSHPIPEAITGRMVVFYKAMAAFIQKQMTVVSPLYNHAALEHAPELGVNWNAWQHYSETLLSKCDRMIIICVPCWRNSTGVAGEIKFAQEHNIPITYVYDFKTFQEETTPDNSYLIGS